MKAPLFLLLMALLAQGLLSDSHVARSQQPEAPEDVIAFGRQVAASLEAQRYEALADLFITHDDQCPLIGTGGVLPICQGIAEGQVVTGYIIGVDASDAGLVSRQHLMDFMDFLDDFGAAPRLYTVGLSGRTGGYTACPECRVIVISSDEAAARGRLAYFHVQAVAGELRLHSLVRGGDRAMLEGGVWEGQRFIVAGPAAPDAGSGTAVADHRRGSTWMLVLGAILLIGSGSVLTWNARRTTPQ